VVMVTHDPEAAAMAKRTIGLRPERTLEASEE